MTLTPQIVGQAENAHKPVLERILAGTGLTGTRWIGLAIASGSGALGREALTGRIAGSLKIGPAESGAVVSDLIDAGLLAEQDAQITLTDAGRARHTEIRSAVDETVGRGYAGISAEDLTTAARVLTVITSQLNALA